MSDTTRCIVGCVMTAFFTIAAIVVGTSPGALGLGFLAFISLLAAFAD